MKKINMYKVVAMLTVLAALPALAEEHAAAATTYSWDAMGFAKAAALGIAALGGALGQAKIAAAALDGIARNPGARDKIFTPMIIGLALVESLVIYALVINLK